MIIFLIFSVILARKVGNRLHMTALFIFFCLAIVESALTLIDTTGYYYNFYLFQSYLLLDELTIINPYF